MARVPCSRTEVSTNCCQPGLPAPASGKQLDMNPTLVCLAVLFGCVIVCPDSDAQIRPRSSDSENVREQFREFYEPLLPRLNASYSVARFRCAQTTPTRAAKNVTYSRGAFQFDRFVFDVLPITRIQNDLSIGWRGQPGLTTLASQYDEDLEPVGSGGNLKDYSFTVAYRRSGKTLTVRHDEKLPPGAYAPLVIAPICSIKLLRSFESIMNDPDTTFFEFLDRKTRSGHGIKTLFYQPGGFENAGVFEADFDARSGACLSSFEFNPDESTRPTILTVRYAEPVNNDLLPAPLVVSTNLSVARRMIIFYFKPVAELPADELSVMAFGFTESDAEKPGKLIEVIAFDATNILLVAALVLVSIFVLIVSLTIVVSLFVKRPVKKTAASEPVISDDLSQ